MKIFCFALDLKNNQELIDEYKQYHKKVWPEIIKSIRDAGIIDMEIYLIGNRLFMNMETDDTFSFERKNQMDAENITLDNKFDYIIISDTVGNFECFGIKNIDGCKCTVGYNNDIMFLGNFNQLPDVNHL